MFFTLYYSDIWNLGAYCRAKQVEYQARGMHSRRTCAPPDDDASEAKRPKLDDDIIQTNIAFFRAHYPIDKELPKSKLHVYAMKQNLPLPIYETEQKDRLFRCILSLGSTKYASTYWEKNKRFAEQGTALVALLHLGLIDEETLIKNGSILK